MRRQNCGGSTVGSNCDEAGHFIKKKQIDHYRRGVYSFHLFGLCSSAAWEHRPPITLQALKQQHPPNTTHLGSSIKHPVSWFTFINFLALERPTSSGYLLPGQLCPPNKQPHTRTGATQNGLRVPETTQVEEPWAADSGTAGPAEHK